MKPSVIITSDSSLECSCGAICKDKKDFNRFRKRHPALCSAHNRVSKALAAKFINSAIDEFEIPSSRVHPDEAVDILIRESERRL